MPLPAARGGGAQVWRWGYTGPIRIWGAPSVCRSPLHGWEHNTRSHHDSCLHRWREARKWPRVDSVCPGRGQWDEDQSEARLHPSVQPQPRQGGAGAVSWPMGGQSEPGWEVGLLHHRDRLSLSPAPVNPASCCQWVPGEGGVSCCCRWTTGQTQSRQRLLAGLQLQSVQSSQTCRRRWDSNWVLLLNYFYVFCYFILRLHLKILWVSWSSITVFIWWENQLKNVISKVTSN